MQDWFITIKVTLVIDGKPVASCFARVCITKRRLENGKEKVCLVYVNKVICVLSSCHLAMPV